MKLKTEGRCEEIVDWFFFSLCGYTGRKGCSLKVEGGKVKKKRCVLSMSALRIYSTMYLDFVLYICKIIFERFAKVYFSGFTTHRFKPLHKDQSVISGCLGKFNSAAMSCCSITGNVCTSTYLCKDYVCAALFSLKASSRVFGQVVIEQGVSKK